MRLEIRDTPYEGELVGGWRALREGPSGPKASLAHTLLGVARCCVLLDGPASRR